MSISFCLLPRFITHGGVLSVAAYSLCFVPWFLCRLAHTHIITKHATHVTPVPNRRTHFSLNRFFAASMASESPASLSPPASPATTSRAPPPPPPPTAAAAWALRTDDAEDVLNEILRHKVDRDTGTRRHAYSATCLLQAYIADKEVGQHVSQVYGRSVGEGSSVVCCLLVPMFQ